MSMIIVTYMKPHYQGALAPADPTGDPRAYWHQNPRLFHKHLRIRTWITATSTRPRERVRQSEPGYPK